MYNSFFCDFHIHIGRSADGSPVKITAANNLTFENIIKECVNTKGIEIIGIVDCASPKVLSDISSLLAEGSLKPLEGGGYRYLNKVTVILGAEVETKEKKGQAHCLCFFPTIEKIEAFSQFLSRHIKNINLSSQQCGLSMQSILEVTDSLEGTLVPAHVFTPHKSIYGKCAKSLEELFETNSLRKIKAVELGLSSDSYYADFLIELKALTFLTNSDAHSLPKIGREYNILRLAEPSFSEVLLALEGRQGRLVTSNYGLDPKLGKYHRTFCQVCNQIATLEPPVTFCPSCGEKEKITIGVLDRINLIKTNYRSEQPLHRPPYIYQIPLQFLPNIGPKTIEKLVQAFGSEMAILHLASIAEISEVVGPAIGDTIRRARTGSLDTTVGGGGRYGKIRGKKNE